MSEIKFRQAIYFNGEFKGFHYWGFISEGNFTAPQCSNQEALKNSQQITGFKDKNGKEIYEGDILMGIYGFAGRPVEVKWNYTMWSVFDKEFGYKNPTHWDLAEVIGNTSENPELK